jgi:hypothetical protein
MVADAFCTWTSSELVHVQSASATVRIHDELDGRMNVQLDGCGRLHTGLVTCLSSQQLGASLAD